MSNLFPLVDRKKSTTCIYMSGVVFIHQSSLILYLIGKTSDSYRGKTQNKLEISLVDKGGKY